jgi:hypothetical protein
MQPSQPTNDKRLRDLEADLAAVIIPGLQCAFRDRQHVTLRGRTLDDEEATRDVWVCGPGAYVVLKALAFDGRGENKDAYDLHYVVRNFGVGIDDVATRLKPLLDDDDAQRAVAILHRDFTTVGSVGPVRVARFLTGSFDARVQADVVGFVSRLLEKIR